MCVAIFISTFTKAGSFVENGNAITIDLNVASQVVTIVSTGSTYTLTLSGGATNTWTGTTSANVTVSGSILTITAAGKTAFNTFNITNSQTANGVTFNTSSANPYSDNFNITLNNTAGAITFNGTSSFDGSNALNITTDGYINFVSASSLSSLNGNISLSANMQNTPNTFAYSGIMVNNATVQITGTGALTMRARGGIGAAASFLNKGIAVINGGIVRGGTTGTTIIEGRGYDNVAGTIQGQGVFVYNIGGSATSTITSNGSDVEVTGYGANLTGTFTASTFNAGVVVGGPAPASTQGGTITSGGNGKVSINGTGGHIPSQATFNVNNYSGSYGVYIAGSNTLISSGGDGLVTINGTGNGGDTLSSWNTGVSLNKANISSGAGGSVVITGTGYTTNAAANSHGVYLNASNVTTGVGLGTINITGYGGDTWNSSTYGGYGIQISGKSLILPGGSGDVNLTGYGGGLAAGKTIGSISSSNGVSLGGNNSDTMLAVINSNGGNVTVTGTAGGYNGGTNIGVYLPYSAYIKAGGNGNVVVTGYGGNNKGTTGDKNYGVLMTSNGSGQPISGITSSGGNVTVTGIGGGGNANTAASSSNTNIGILCDQGGFISAGGLGTVTVSGTGGNTSPGSTGNNNCGVQVNAFATRSGTVPSVYQTKITTGGGNLIINGTGGGAGTSTSNHGVYNLGLIKPMGQGTLTITGNGGTGTTGSTNYGVYCYNTATANSVVYPATISSDSANVTVTGTGGGSSSATSNYGVYANLGGVITAGATGAVNVVGNGGNTNGIQNYGVYVNAGASPYFSTITSGGGNISVTGVEGGSSSSLAVNVTSSAKITTSTNGGNISIKGNSFGCSNCVVSAASSSSVSFIPLSNNTPLQFSSATDITGTLSFSQTELAKITGGNINIGDANTGLINVSQAVTIPTGSNLKLANSAGITPKVSGTEITMATGKTLDIAGVPSINIAINGTTVNTQYDQFKVVADINITGKTLNLSGTYTTTGGDIFTIVDATSITGTFTGLANGATVTLNGRTLIINYTATQVTLTDPAPYITNNPINATVIAGNTVTFTAAATSLTTAPTVQWQVSTNGGTSYTDINGATTATYSFTAAGSDNGNKYRAVFSNSYGSATSTAAALAVNVTPYIVSQPSSITTTVGNTAYFISAASGFPTPSAQWQINSGNGWSNILGATNSTYSFVVASSDNGNKYRVVYTNLAGIIYSDSAILTIPPTQVQLNLKAYIQGLYIGSGLMISAPFSSDGISPLSIADTITIELRDTTASHVIVYSSKCTLDTAGNVNVIFPASANGGKYYIVIKHRNSISTWSSNPINFGSLNSYNFSISGTQAFGSNLLDDGTGTFLIYSGDINQDGSVDFNDYPSLDIASSNGLLGYDVNDLNGDASVDFNDYPILDISSSFGAIEVTP